MGIIPVIERRERFEQGIKRVLSGYEILLKTSHERAAVSGFSKRDLMSSWPEALRKSTRMAWPRGLDLGLHFLFPIFAVFGIEGILDLV